MKGHRILSHIAAIFFLACVCVSCESSSSSSYDPGGCLAADRRSLVGSWAGHFVMGENGLAPDDNEYGDSFDTYSLEPDDDDIFVIGDHHQGKRGKVCRGSSRSTYVWKARLASIAP
ncbi:MAG: hypothetical protein ACOX2W_02330 [Desulfomonilia bacterium]